MSVSGLRVLPVCRACYSGFERQMGSAVPRITSVGGTRACPWCKTVSAEGLYFAPMSLRRSGLVSGDVLKRLEK